MFFDLKDIIVIFIKINEFIRARLFARFCLNKLIIS